MYKADVHRNLIKVMISAFEPNEEDEKLLRSAELALKENRYRTPCWFEKIFKFAGLWRKEQLVKILDNFVFWNELIM